METVSFMDIARTLKYSSNRTDAIYALLDLFDKDDIVLSTKYLEEYIGFFPNDFSAWLLAHKNVNILFEHHTLSKRNAYFGDWDLVDG